MIAFACIVFFKPCPYVGCVADVAFSRPTDAFQDVCVVHLVDVRKTRSSCAQGSGGHQHSLVPSSLLACHPKLVSEVNERRMVEAGGVEPPSENNPLKHLHT
jgi:hypothetical protein